MKTLVLATNNPGKVRELQQLGAGLPLERRSLADYPEVPPVPETGITYDANAAIKTRTVAQKTGEWALADDSCLEVDALNGAPGIRSSRFGGPGATDADRIRLLLDPLRDVPGPERTARFRAAVAIASPESSLHITEGTCEGIIAREPSGSGGFGYDPIFYLPELGMTMAQLPPEKKNEISHRARAVRAARQILEKLLAESG